MQRTYSEILNIEILLYSEIKIGVIFSAFMSISYSLTSNATVIDSADTEIELILHHTDVMFQKYTFSSI